MAIIGCIVPEIWNRTDRTFFSFWAILYPFTPLATCKINILKKWKKIPGDIILHMCTKNENHMMYGSQDKEYHRHNFFSFWTICCCYSPVTTKKNQNFEKLEKTHGDTIILHKGTINDNHTMHCSWDVKHSRQDFLLFWAIFCPFNPITAQKIKILKK